MKICMISSFFGRNSFGGDSIYIERLSHALSRQGHDVHIVHSSSAYDLVRGSQPQRTCSIPPEIVIHDIGSRLGGKLSAFWNHQTGGAGLGFQKLGYLLKRTAFDLIHLHNVSLLGGRVLPDLLKSQAHAVKLVTAHDYWWICPQSLFWKYGRKTCDACACMSCALISHRPPQLWRRRDWFNSALSSIDAILFPSQSTMEIYQSRGLVHPKQSMMPGLLPADWDATRNSEETARGSLSRSYFVSAGRLVIEKGFQKLIPMMKQMPDMDLRIAGCGPAEKLLRQLAHGLHNVRFEGLLDHDAIRRLFRGARAIIVPSLFPETFGLVAAEGLSLGIPVIARNRGSLPELINATSGGLLFDSEDQLADQMRRIASDDDLFGRLSHSAATQIPQIWSEGFHVKAYLKLVASLRGEGAQS